jgi:hypothetical protein
LDLLRIDINPVRHFLPMAVILNVLFLISSISLPFS